MSTSGSNTDGFITFDLRTNSIIANGISLDDYRGSSNADVLPAMAPCKSVEEAPPMDDDTKQELSNAGILSPDGTIDYDAFTRLPPIEAEGMLFPTDELAAEPTPRTIVNNTMLPPYKCIAYLVIKFGNHLGRGTGFVIGPNVIVTSAHCLCNYQTKQLASAVFAFPAMNGDYQPFKFNGFRIRISDAWWTKTTQEHNVAGNDWGLIEFKENISMQTGCLGIAKTSVAFVGKDLHMPGFPSTSNDGQYTTNMWTAKGKMLHYSDNPNYNTTRHFISQTGGSSGSPVMLVGNENYVTGIHSGGAGNIGLACGINDIVYNVIDAFRRYYDI